MEEFEGQVTAGAGAPPIDAKKFHICGMEDSSGVLLVRLIGWDMALLAKQPFQTAGIPSHLTRA